MGTPTLLGKATAVRGDRLHADVVLAGLHGGERRTTIMPATESSAPAAPSTPTAAAPGPADRSAPAGQK